MASELAEAFNIDTEVSPAYLDDLLKFIVQYYILKKQVFFRNVNRTVINNDPVLTFTLIYPKTEGFVDVEIRARKPIEVTMTPSDEMVPKGVLGQLREDLGILVQLFEEEVRKTTLYFSWIEGEEVIPEKIMATHKKATGRIFFDSMLPLFIIFIALNFFVFMYFGYYAPIILVAVQFVMIFFSDKIIARLGDWTISQRNPSIHLLQYHLPVEEHRNFLQKYGMDQIVEMKREIYEKTLAVKGELDCQTAKDVFGKYGMECKPENMSAKKVNVYQLVKSAAEKFNLPIPKIALSNTMLPNAAATGISPSRGTVLVTTGLLVQLEEDETLSVLGHEFSHLKGRDPLILFALSISEFLFRLYVFFPFLFTLPSLTIFLFFQYLYFPVAMGAIYFVGKFLESRADLESAIKIGEPKVLAEALRKIGFRRLQFERMPAFRIQEWIGWDPHPPIYFRIGRLEKMETPVEEKHPLIRSIKDVINGFMAMLRPS